MARQMLASDRVLLLLSLVPYLREHGPTPITELARTFDADPRTLRNLIAFLGTAGIPGETLAYQHNDLFDIDWDAFEQHDIVSLTQTVAVDETPRFTGVETAALLAGLAALRPLLAAEDALLASALADRLGSLMGTAELPAVVVSQEDPQGDLASLLRAIEDGRAVRFNYRDAAGNTSTRTVHPASLAEREGTWYLHGFNVERAAQRTFSVPQLSDLTVLDQASNTADAAQMGTADGESEGGLAATEARESSEILALVPTRLLGTIRGFAPQQVTSSDVAVPPGMMLVRIDAWHAGAAVRLAQHGPGEIEIVAPPAARAAVSGWAESALAAYGE